MLLKYLKGSFASVQHGHLRYWGLTSELQLKPKARHQFWAGLTPKTNPLISNTQTLKALPTGRTYKSSLQQRKCSNVSGNFIEAI